MRGKRREIRTNELLVLEQESFLLQSCAGWANITKVQITNKQIDIPMTQPTLIIYVTDTAIIIRQKLYLWQQQQQQQQHRHKLNLCDQATFVISAFHSDRYYHSIPTSAGWYSAFDQSDTTNRFIVPVSSFNSGERDAVLDFHLFVVLLLVRLLFCRHGNSKGAFWRVDKLLDEDRTVKFWILPATGKSPWSYYGLLCTVIPSDSERPNLAR